MKKTKYGTVAIDKTHGKACELCAFNTSENRSPCKKCTEEIGDDGYYIDKKGLYDSAT